MKVLISALAAGLLTLTATSASADEVTERITERLQSMSPDLEPERVEATPLEGIYLIVVQGQVAYISEDGRYLIQGDIMDLDAQESLSDALQGELRRDRIEEHGEDNMIVYRPDGEIRHTVTVFTDIDCPYCRQMHGRMDAYLDAGIAIRYLQMPRAGVGTASYDKAVSVWCADDRNAAMDAAKAGETPEHRECSNPVEEQLYLAQSLGVNATPTIISENGTVHRGMVPPDELLQRLDSE
ncbi:DsbC family protein [Aquisalimonas sp.]|uniref:DsbC family protein n=1 Tax=unclassified Aquisalimonas TaxID=2644645 RepID=UPI0025BB2FA4|nr:DsbC family protein [Aquisalimonas sp.]